MASHLIKKSLNRNLLRSLSALQARTYSKQIASVNVPLVKLNDSQTSINQTNRTFHISSKYLNDTVSIDVPAFAESIKEGTIKLLKKPGEAVKADEIVAQIETDKTTLDVISPQNGVIESSLVEDNSVVTAFAKVFTLKTGAAATPAAAAESKPTEATPPPPPPSTPSQELPYKSAMEPPKVTQAQQAPAVKQTIPITSIPVTPYQPIIQSSQQQDINKISGTRSETKVKMSRMRQTVANRLKTAQNTCAMLTTFNEINMGNLVELRKTYGDAFFKKHGLKLGFMSAFVKAAVCALQDQPVVNAVIENNEIVYRDYVDVSVAVATPKGLVVPVLRNCEKMNYADIEKEINLLGVKARDNKLAIEDMQGGTFTISNGGVFGSLFGTPIINLPQSAILGMHGVFDRPIAINGQVVIKPMMYVALTYDHRLVDGREAVTFLRKIKSAVEDPRTLLLDI